ARRTVPVLTPPIVGARARWWEAGGARLTIPPQGLLLHTPAPPSAGCRPVVPEWSHDADLPRAGCGRRRGAAAGAGPHRRADHGGESVAAPPAVGEGRRVRGADVAAVGRGRDRPAQSSPRGGAELHDPAGRGC